MRLGTKEIPALRLGAAAVLKAYLGGSQVWPLGLDPAALFAQGEQGVWYDPSDLSTLFQDAAGTTPVTAVEQPVGLMLDKSGRGNHASQPTATSRPVLSARVNLLTKTEQFDDAYWANHNTTVTPNAVISPDGNTTADKLKETSATGVHTLYKALAIPANVKVKISVALKAAERSFALVGDAIDAVTVNLTTGIASRAAGTNIDDVTSVSLGDGWFRVSYTITKAANSDVYFYLSIDGVHANRSFTGTTDYGIYIWGADLRVANDGANLPPYQRVNTATDYDTVGFPHYLCFDGVDDGLVTNTITPGTDKVQVFAGVRKLSDTAAGTVFETSTDHNFNNGTFALIAPINSGVGNSSFVSRGTSIVGTTAASFAAPTTAVITGSASISEDVARQRRNGSQVAQTTADQGTGNYLAYPLYIGRRGGTTLPFNGRLYSLIVRFGSNLPAAMIEKTEKYINTKTRAY